MQFTVSTLLALGLALTQTSFAAPSAPVTLNPREVFNLPPGDQFIACPDYEYSAGQVAEAIQEGIRLMQAGQQLVSHTGRKFQSP